MENDSPGGVRSESHEHASGCNGQGVPTARAADWDDYQFVFPVPDGQIKGPEQRCPKYRHFVEFEQIFRWDANPQGAGLHWLFYSGVGVVLATRFRRLRAWDLTTRSSNLQYVPTVSAHFGLVL